MKKLNFVVFPSEEQTIKVKSDEIYNGAHYYEIQDSIGYNNNKTEYVDSIQSIQFIEKKDDGTTIPGIQSEQLVYVLLDRIKLNNRFPSEHNEKMISGLNQF